MAQLLTGLCIGHFNGSTLTLADQPWKTNLNALYEVNQTRNGWRAYKPSSAFPSVTQVEDGKHYLLDVKTAFDFPGMSLVGTSNEAGGDLEILLVDATPTEGSDNLVSSGGVFSSLSLLQNPKWEVFGNATLAAKTPPFCIRYTESNIELAGTGHVDGIVFDYIAGAFKIATGACVFSQNTALGAGAYYRASAGGGTTSTEPTEVGTNHLPLFRIIGTGATKRVVVNIGAFTQGIDVVEITGGGGTTGPDQTKVLDYISVTANPVSMSEGNSSIVSVIAHFTDGTTYDVSANANTTYQKTAGVGTMGTGAAKNVLTVDMNSIAVDSSATVQATYSQGGVSKSASVNISVLNVAEQSATTLTGIAVTPNAFSVGEGFFQDLQVMAEYSNAATENVSISENTTYASSHPQFASFGTGLNANRLSVPGNVVDTDTPITVTVTHTYLGVTKSVTIPVTVLNNVEPVFRETFLNKTGANVSLSNYGWLAYVGASRNTVTTNGVVNAGSGKAGTSLPAVNAAYGTIDYSNDAASLLGTATITSVNNRALLFTEKFQLPTPPRMAKWDHGHQAGDYSTRFAVRVGANWYAHAQGHAQASVVANSTGFPANALHVEQPMAPGAAEWLPIAFATGALSVDYSATPVALPVGNITAFGWYTGTLSGLDSTTGTNRYDNLEIYL
ncbi:hypothetical protein [Rufibacter latericius]|uniref:Uncharacterized protein n=1 Tax=Rufibacter latericius TaxID=2487040 RepID=A0A3M9MMA5_9BACT|nr:hypothetical protein [Rufibacter latericius]RNI26639.1 hypothetical protein EFB08_11515 [Rufibacter latericius]